MTFDPALTPDEKFLLLTHNIGDIKTVLSLSKKGYVNAHTLDFMKGEASLWLTPKGRDYLHKHSLV